MEKSKHPKGLPYLFFAEMWERFGYYLMIGIFVLYMMDGDKGGWGWDRTKAYDIYGTFIALVFLTPFIGGLLADRLLGYSLSITIGGIMMGSGYCLLAVKGETVFWIALTLIMIGNGFFKPNISTLLGNLYNDEKYKPLKDSGYNIFYMGINIGAAICNFFGAAMRNNWGWSAAFFTAGIGMFVGVAIFWLGMKHYRHADVRKPLKQGDLPLGVILGSTIVPAIAAGIGGWFLPGNVFGSDSTDAFIFGALPVLGYYIFILVRAEKTEKRPLGAMMAIFAIVIVFWAVFKQNGTALTTWAESYTNRNLPAAAVPAVEKLSLAQTVTMKQDSVVLTDHHFRKIKTAEGKEQKVIAYPDYFKNEHPKPAEGATYNLVNTEIFQSINPIWVVILSLPVVAFFVFLNRRRREPSTPTKIAIGLIISALSTLVMVGAVYMGDNGATKVSPLWLIGAYGVITVGELFLSPMGLSLVSKLSPPRLTALMMGGWFLSTSIGNKLSGILATMWDGYEDKRIFFLVNFALLGGAAIALFLMLRWLNKIFREYGG